MNLEKKSPSLLAGSKRKSFQEFLTKKGIQPSSAHRITPRGTPGPAPLSYPQQRIWLQNQMDPTRLLYNVPQVIRMRGPLDVAAVEKMIFAVLQRHEILRTTYQVMDDMPVQIVRDPAPVALPIVDLTDLADSEREWHLNRRLVEVAQRAFDLENGPMLRTTLFKLREDDHALLMEWHHITSDGWSMAVRLGEMSAVYNAVIQGREAELEELPIQYADYAVWQRKWLDRDRIDSLLRYWTKALEGIPSLLELPTDRPRPATQTFRGETLAVSFSPELSQAIVSFGRDQNTTTYMTILAGLQCLFYQYTGQTDIVIGSPIANRQRSEIESMIGIFMNLLPLRGNLEGDPKIVDLLDQIKHNTKEAYAHQDIPFELLVNEVQSERNQSYSPMFQVMFNLLNMPKQPLNLRGLETDMHHVDLNLSRFDISLYLTESEGVLEGRIEYSTDLFDRSTIERMIGHLQILLDAMIRNPTQRISELPTVSAVEKQQVLSDWNRYDVPYARDKRIHQLFEEQVARTPDSTALVFGDGEMTYAELNSRSDRLAGRLTQLGVVPNECVGICLDRSMEMVVATLGILKAGGAFVPIDPEFPVERTRMVLEDAAISKVVANEPFDEERCLPVLKYISPNDSSPADRAETSGHLPIGSSEDLAYTLFTSGSTGRPKGVAITHRALVNFLLAMEREPGMDANDNVLALTTNTFDISHLEIFLPLIVGGRVILLSRQQTRDPAAIAKAIVDRNVTLMQSTPATWQMLMTDGWEGKSDLKMLIGGEACPLGLAKELTSRGASLWNMYGPTETTVWSTLERIGPEVDRITIGRAIANTRLYVVNDRLQPVPIGVPGELLIGGDGVAHGYLNRPELTEERFIADPFSPDSTDRVYRTGDLVKWLQDGRLEFIGRCDSQIKIRGFRVELGEIEHALKQLPSVGQSAVVLQGESADDKLLIAYVVPEANQTCEPESIRTSLTETLPAYMIPHVILPLDAFPLTSSGKVNRKALPRFEASSQTLAERTKPRNPTEEDLAGIFEAVLEIDEVGIDDEFFSLGGHSLKAMNIISRIHNRFGCNLPFTEFFQRPTVASLAAWVDEQNESRDYEEIEI